tara:strand:- start:9693 stop:10592 length:900 start_codon:yes stop_codon:yes gene_type:complete
MPKKTKDKITSTIRKKPRRRINRGKAVVSMANRIGNVGKTFGTKAYNTSIPMIRDTAKSIGQSVSNMIDEQRVPRVPNNGAWEDLRKGFSEGLVNVGILDYGETIPTPVYFQSVKRFLEMNKDIMINKNHIQRVKGSFKSMHPDNITDSTPETMKDIFTNGITRDNLVSAFELGFQKVILPDSDMDIESESGEGFQMARDKTMEKLKKAQIVNLASGIKRLLGTNDPLGYYKEQIKQKFEKLNSLITNDDELKVLQVLVKEHPELKDLMLPYGRQKKKTKRRKKKKKKSKKHTKRRKKK